MLDPVETRISEHFLLSDFLGNTSVYSRGYANVFEEDDLLPRKLCNAQALAEELLEPLLIEHGPISISYGYISPELSRKIVTYQDPDKPSHHRWDLGAAADVLAHRWIMEDSPIALAHWIEKEGVPYSRMITYSESPYLCLAASAEELRNGNKPRRAFYENRYMGQPRAKPSYRQYSTDAAKQRAHLELESKGLEHDWIGAGYPTYHGGGRQQYQHMRVSEYTMVSDWLFDLQSVANGVKNVPSLNDDAVQDSFAAAGIVYDWMINVGGVERFSIVAGYVSHLNPSLRNGNDWRRSTIQFQCVAPESVDADEIAQHLTDMLPDFLTFSVDDRRVMTVTLGVHHVLEAEG